MLRSDGSRRRDVQVIFTLGAGPGEGGAATLKDVLPSTSSATTPSHSSPLVANEVATGETAAEEAAVRDDSPSAGRTKGRLAGLHGRQGRRKATAERSETSRPIMFKTVSQPCSMHMHMHISSRRAALPA